MSDTPRGNGHSATPAEPQRLTRPGRDPGLWSDADRKFWEGEKLLAEVRKTEREASNARYAVWLQGSTALFSAITVSVAIVGLLLSNAAQRRQVVEVRFNDALRSLVERPVPDRGGAVAILSGYVSDSARRHQMLGVLVQQLRGPDPFLADKVSEVLLRAPDNQLIEELARENRLLSKALSARDSMSVFPTRVIADNRDIPSTPTDTAAARLREQLSLNGQMLVRAFARMHRVHGIDLSDVVFLSGRIEVRVDTTVSDVPGAGQSSKPSGGLGSFLRGLPALLMNNGLPRHAGPRLEISDVDFDSVSFARSSLAYVSFRNGSFKRVNFDSANLAGTRFWTGTFGLGTTFKDFSLGNVIGGGTTPYLDYVSFYECSFLDGIQLAPDSSRLRRKLPSGELGSVLLFHFSKDSMSIPIIVLSDSIGGRLAKSSGAIGTVLSYNRSGGLRVDSTYSKTMLHVGLRVPRDQFIDLRQSLSSALRSQAQNARP